jgi:uncharacterized membrane protein HdeD (DUF308 family)
MDDPIPNGNSQHRVQLGFWITVFRGILGIILGLMLLINPDKTPVMLFNFMGFYWLLTGIAFIRRAHVVFGKDTERVFGVRLERALGVIALLTGLLVVTRSLTWRWIDGFFLFELLGVGILLTGVLHLLAEFRVGRVVRLGRTTAHKVLAIFEIILGTLLIISPMDHSSIVYWTAIVWALLGGVMILADALTVRARARRPSRRR